jgi:AcrR family transcriptional regulator
MSETSTAQRKRVLDGARTVFARYGFRKATMEDIAREAGVSRPALYQWFDGKRAVFQALAELVAAEALSAADAAWPEAAGLAEGLPAAILAKDLPLYRLLHASPHGAELLAVDAALAALLATDLEAAFATLLAGKARHLPGLDLAALGGADGFGTTVARLAAGLKATAASEGEYVDDVRRLCRLAAAACGVTERTLRPGRIAAPP